MEASLGALWGEDPRYFPSPRRGFGTRVKYVIRTTFVAPHRDGTWHPAYARYIGNVGNNFLSNTWRVDSENGAGNALVRCVFGVVGRMSGNAFAEFWPDVRKRVWRKSKAFTTEDTEGHGGTRAGISDFRFLIAAFRRWKIFRGLRADRVTLTPVLVWRNYD
jgi:hypothetical protein